jgi:glycosyltransferase involved in cell wall biosynthesis
MAMKLAIVTRYFPPDVISGRETVIYNLWRKALGRYGDNVTLITGWRKDPNLLPKEALRIKQAFDSKLLNYVTLYLWSAVLLRQVQPDVILCNAIEAAIGGFPSAVIVHDLNFGQADSRRGRNWMRRRIISWQLVVSEKTIVVSSATKGRVQELGVPESKVAVIHNGVDLSKFQPREPSEDPSRELTVVYPSRILHGKGQHVAVEAVRLLSSNLRRNVKLIIVGFAQDAEYLQQLRSNSSGLPVEFAINMPQIVPYYQRADIVVFPTIMEEGFGYTAVEAMACAKPVIYSDYPAISEATGGIGIPVPPDDPQALADALADLMLDSSERARLGSAGRSFVESHYSWEVVFEQYVAVLEELTNVGGV